nr:hypothetical protein [Tanacetum cinerariifolium]
MVRDSVQLETAVNTISYEYLLDFTSEYSIPETLHPELPGPGDRIGDFPEARSVCTLGATKVSYFEINCRMLNIIPVFYTPSFNSGWMSLSKRSGKNTPQCYTKPLDSLKNWNNRFFWVDERVFPTVVDWRTNASKDGMPVNGTYSVEDVRALDTHRTPIQKQPEVLLCMVGISRRYYLGDEVYPTFHYDDDREMDLFSLIRAPNPTKPAIATDSSGVPSTIERSPLDFSHEAEASGRGTAAPEMPPPEDVPTITAPGADQAVETVAAEPPVARESHKRGHDGTDANAPPKSLRRDHADLRPSGSSRGGKSLAAMQLCLASNVFVSEGVPADVCDPDPLAFADAPSSRPADVAHQNGVSPMVAYSTPLKPARTWWTMLLSWVRAGGQAATKIRCSGGSPGPKDPSPGVRNKKPGGTAGDIGRYEEGCRREECWVEPRIGKNACPVLGTSGCRWVIGHGMRLAMMKCAESLEMRQAFADVVSVGVAKVLQSLKDLKYPMLDQLEGLKNAHMDVIMAALYLKSDTGGGDAPQFIRDLRPSSSQLAILMYPEVRDPRNPWAYKEEIKLSDAIETNISRAEKKKKCRIVCRTHGIGSAPHARSDCVPVSVPTMVPQGLALLLVDAATQTDE